MNGYRVVDQYGQVIDVLRSARRGTDAAPRFFRRPPSTLKLKPTEVATDVAVLNESIPSMCTTSNSTPMIRPRLITAG